MWTLQNMENIYLHNFPKFQVKMSLLAHPQKVSF